MKNKIESKLAQGGRQVKTPRGQALAGTPENTMQIETPENTMPVETLPTSAATPPAATKLDRLHPRRVWPD